ncbi:uncharacterized protein (DUF302 family) [Shimia isoporae]|uniref:Uncharacterized protein (DUF302 family) n=1 Tax=Shimia isoporae TaxID=647720 RepID=A0A4R1NNX6_9RHOB|nr:DUF302 domain-containing protein [Shimia isoporae]TCL10034.1 uncharacterized protein (DUF302 family) [Shimia isoporae]
MKRFLSTCAALAAFAMPVAAMDDDIVKVAATGSVAETMDALEAAVTKAGVAVFARIDHGAGAKSVDMDLGDSQLLIFGSPKIGTPAMQDDPLAGLYLPLKVLVYQDAEGKVWLAYENPTDMLDDLTIANDAAYLGKMAGALGKLTGVAAGQ